MESLTRTGWRIFRLEDAHTIGRRFRPWNSRENWKDFAAGGPAVFIGSGISVTAEGETSGGQQSRSGQTVCCKEEEAQKAGISSGRDGGVDVSARQYSFAGIYQWKENKFIPGRCFCNIHMKVLTSLRENRKACPTAVTVGKFDGLHRGHDLLAHRILEQKGQGLSSVVVTFDTSPGGASRDRKTGRW